MKSASQTKVAVAMSGGVDSSVAAALLVDQGVTVFGITAVMAPDVSRCCSDEDVQRAREVAARLGVRHHLVDLRSRFAKDVIEPFTAGYLAGRTPSPCVVCNAQIKFGALLNEARKLGADALATGHYVRRTPGTGRAVHLRRGLDAGKDQSYFLARLRQGQLQAARFPLGEMHKADVTACAAARGLACRKSRESQELCFVAEETHGDWIDLRSFDTRGPGPIVDTTGARLGEHRGIHHYTIGQRKGLGIATGTPVYVIAIEPDANRIVVGGRVAAMGRQCRVNELTWIDRAPQGTSARLLAQIRYNHTAAPCRLALHADGSGEIEFEESQFAVTPGQLAAFYEGDHVLGAGWIA